MILAPSLYFHKKKLPPLNANNWFAISHIICCKLIKTCFTAANNKQKLFPNKLNLLSSIIHFIICNSKAIYIKIEFFMTTDNQRKHQWLNYLYISKCMVSPSIIVFRAHFKKEVL